MTPVNKVIELSVINGLNNSFNENFGGKYNFLKQIKRFVITAVKVITILTDSLKPLGR